MREKEHINICIEIGDDPDINLIILLTKDVVEYTTEEREHRDIEKQIQNTRIAYLRNKLEELKEEL